VAASRVDANIARAENTNFGFIFSQQVRSAKQNITWRGTQRLVTTRSITRVKTVN
jgi:hypothetical protein